MDRARQYGLFVNEHADFIEEVARQQLLRGVLPVRKGEGRRALAKAGTAKKSTTLTATPTIKASAGVVTTGGSGSTSASAGATGKS